MECYNCFSENVIETDENFTCINCSHIQSILVLGRQTEKIECYNHSNSFISEYSEREKLSEKDQVEITRRLNILKNRKSVFSKLDLMISLIHMIQIEGGIVKSAQAYCMTIGNLITPKRLNMCLCYLKKELKMTDKSHLDWLKLLNPFCERYVFLRRNEVEYLKTKCEKLRLMSNLSVFSIAAITFLFCFVHFRDVDFDSFLLEISYFSKISKATLKKNYKKYKSNLC